MEGWASNFKVVLADFESRLHGAEFVAVDTELTGVEFEAEPDTFEESAAVRLDKLCRIAERYTLIQLGLTIVGRDRQAGEGHLTCASYNIFAFPYTGPELHGTDRGFFCQASSMQFNAQHRLDFNTWIHHGVPYMSREDAKKFLESPIGKEDLYDRKVGLLRLWKSLCAARLPLIVHSPLDLFFLLTAFERRPLPRSDPRALAILIRQCTPKVYDTAHLHGCINPPFKRLGLTKFFPEAKARYEEMANHGNSVLPLSFRLVGDTAVRYSKPVDELAHEAGFDSLLTAQLFAYLRAIQPLRIKEGANRLFLYSSVEYLDLDRAAMEGEIGANVYDLSRVTLLVAVLDPCDGSDATRLIAASGTQFKKIDNSHILVVLRASGGAAIRKAGELAAHVHGVVSWMPFDKWRSSELAKTKTVSTGAVDSSVREEPVTENEMPAVSPTPAACAVVEDSYGEKCRGGRNLFAVSSVLLFLLVLKGRMAILSTTIRLLRKLRRG